MLRINLFTAEVSGFSAGVTFVSVVYLMDFKLVSCVRALGPEIHFTDPAFVFFTIMLRVFGFNVYMHALLCSVLFVTAIATVPSVLEFVVYSDACA